MSSGTWESHVGWTTTLWCVYCPICIGNLAVLACALSMPGGSSVIATNKEHPNSVPEMLMAHMNPCSMISGSCLFSSSLHHMLQTHCLLSLKTASRWIYLFYTLDACATKSLPGLILVIQFLAWMLPSQESTPKSPWLQSHPCLLSSYPVIPSYSIFVHLLPKKRNVLFIHTLIIYSLFPLKYMP